MLLQIFWFQVLYTFCWFAKSKPLWCAEWSYWSRGSDQRHRWWGGWGAGWAAEGGGGQDPGHPSGDGEMGVLWFCPPSLVEDAHTFRRNGRADFVTPLCVLIDVEEPNTSSLAGKHISVVKIIWWFYESFVVWDVVVCMCLCRWVIFLMRKWNLRRMFCLCVSWTLWL